MADLARDIEYAFPKGNPQTFTSVYNTYFERLYVFAMNMIDDQGESEDIVIKAFTKLFERHAHFSALPQIRSFLYITVRHSCLDYLKYAQRLTERQKRFQQMAVLDQDTDNAQIAGEVLAALYASLENLPQESRKVLELIYIDGLKYREVAERLGISLETVKSQRKYAIDKLKNTGPYPLNPPAVVLYCVWLIPIKESRTSLFNT